MPPQAPEFDHYTPADWLLRHPEVLNGDAPSVLDSLARFEMAFGAINALVK